VDVNSYLFGSLLALTWQDVVLSAVLTVIVTVLYILFYHRLFAVSFDEPFAKSAGLPTGITSALLAALTAAVVVLGLRLMGALLISALILFPPLSAMRVFGSYRAVTLGAAGFAMTAFLAGLWLSWECNTPIGATIVMSNLALYLICIAAKKIKVLFRRGNFEEYTNAEADCRP
jgi:zinc transport system permease protein